jgi:hypothetical protein
MVLRLRPCRSRIRLRCRKRRLIRLRRAFRPGRHPPSRSLLPLGPRALFRPAPVRRVRFREVRRFPRGRYPLLGQVRFYRDHDSLFRPAWATVRKLLRLLRRAWLLPVWLLPGLRALLPRACRASPRPLGRRPRAPAPPRLLRSLCGRRPNRILPASLKPGRWSLRVLIWSRD